MKRLTTMFLLPVLILALGFFGRYLILNKAHPVSLKADSLSWAVEKGLQAPSAGSYLPIEGKDYTISNIKYFEGKQWAVVTAAPIGATSDTEILVLQNKNGGFQKVVGPGNSFHGANLTGLPSDVVKYINPTP